MFLSQVLNFILWLSFPPLAFLPEFYLFGSLGPFKLLAFAAWSRSLQQVRLFTDFVSYCILKLFDVGSWILSTWVIAFWFQASGFELLDVRFWHQGFGVERSDLSLEFCVHGFSLLDLIFYFLPNLTWCFSLFEFSNFLSLVLSFDRLLWHFDPLILLM